MIDEIERKCNEIGIFDLDRISAIREQVADMHKALPYHSEEYFINCIIGAIRNKQ